MNSQLISKDEFAAMRKIATDAIEVMNEANSTFVVATEAHKAKQLGSLDYILAMQSYRAACEEFEKVKNLYAVNVESN